jgi:hypothetical protein
MGYMHYPAFCRSLRTLKSRNDKDLSENAKSVSLY